MNEKDKLLDLLKTFDSISFEGASEYFYKKCAMPKDKFLRMILSLNFQKIITYKGGYICLRGIWETNERSSFVLRFILEKCHGNLFFCEKARPPFDYLIQNDETLYKILDYTNDGLYKLNFLNNMPPDTEIKDIKIVPVIILRNQDIDVIDKELYPKTPFLIASFTFDNEEKNMGLSIKEMP